MTTQANSPRKLWLMILAGVLLIAAMTIALHTTFTVKSPGAADFYIPWLATHEHLYAGADPYSKEVGYMIQLSINGQYVPENEDQAFFVYPYYTTFLVAPFTTLPYDWAQALWQSIIMLSLVVSLFLLISYFKWRPSPLIFGLVTLWWILFYPVARNLFLGQLAVIVYLLTLIVLWLIFRRTPPTAQSDFAAGVLLALTSIKPQMQVLIVPLLVLWTLRQRRWYLTVGLAAAMLVLLGASFALMPAWLGEWLTAIRGYTTYTPPGVLNILLQETLHMGQVGLIIEVVTRVALLGYLLYEWWGVLRNPAAPQDRPTIDWVIGLTLVITQLVAPRMATTYFIVYLYPLLMLFQRLSALGRRGTIAIVALLVALGVGPWWLFLATLTRGTIEANINYVPLPLLMLPIILALRPRTPAALPEHPIPATSAAD
jgi:hypothetical protein